MSPLTTPSIDPAMTELQAQLKQLLLDNAAVRKDNAELKQALQESQSQKSSEDILSMIDMRLKALETARPIASIPPLPPLPPQPRGSSLIIPHHTTDEPTAKRPNTNSTPTRAPKSVPMDRETGRSNEGPRDGSKDYQALL
jgi:hypothetical protein